QAGIGDGVVGAVAVQVAGSRVRIAAIGNRVEILIDERLLIGEKLNALAADVAAGRGARKKLRHAAYIRRMRRDHPRVDAQRFGRLAIADAKSRDKTLIARNEWALVPCQP